MTSCYNPFMLSHLYTSSIAYFYFYIQTLWLALLKKNVGVEKYGQDLFELFQDIVYKTRQLDDCYEGPVQKRYMYSRLPVPKSNWSNCILPQYDDDRWRGVTRMDPGGYCVKVRSSFIAGVMIAKWVSGNVNTELH